MIKGINILKKMLVIGMVLALFGSLMACDSSDVADQVTNVVQQENENVLAVKNAVPSEYPNTTYGEAFDNFFGTPTWKYFLGTEEGPDDNGDGEPDYIIEDIDVVEFTGTCMYQDVQVKALIQFSLDNDAGFFEATYLSFNDVPQNNLVLASLLQTVFSEAESEIVSDEPISTESKDYIFPDSDKVYYNEQALYDEYDYDTLWYGKNEIYAKHGYIFNNELLRTYFESLDWYNGTVPSDEFDESVFNEYEKSNVQVLQNVLDYYGGDHEIEDVEEDLLDGVIPLSGTYRNDNSPYYFIVEEGVYGDVNTDMFVYVTIHCGMEGETLVEEYTGMINLFNPGTMTVSTGVQSAGYIDYDTTYGILSGGTSTIVNDYISTHKYYYWDTYDYDYYEDNEVSEYYLELN